MTQRIAMWSGPRNISTAMMRSFEARGDCRVVDEPFYAAYLQRTGLKHPMRDAILASQPTAWEDVIRDLDGPHSRPVQYEKHMTHHLLPELNLDWLDRRTHAFLLRHPAEVVASYARRHDRIRPEDLGIMQQARLFDHLCRQLGSPPVVIHARDILRDPEAALSSLCEALGLRFTPRMLSWKPGLRATDGVWASHWYDSVAASTGFGSTQPAPTQLPAGLQRVCDALIGPYEGMAAHALPS